MTVIIGGNHLPSNYLFPALKQNQGSHKDDCKIGAVTWEVGHGHLIAENHIPQYDT